MGTQIFIIIIIITINNRILNFLECISIGIFHWENVLNFHERKMEDTSKDGTLLTRLLTRLFSAKYCLLARKKYLTAATYYCEVEVKVRDRTAAVDAIFLPISCSDIISKQFGGRRVGLETSNCDSFTKMS